MMTRSTHRRMIGLLALAAAVFILLFAPFPVGAAESSMPASSAAPTPGAEFASNRTPNPIQIENAHPGSAAWQIALAHLSGPGHLIEGYADHTSVNLGSPITFYVNTAPTIPYTVDVYRMGWYQGLGARLITEIPALPGATQPPCPQDTVTALIQCVWSPSLTLTVPLTWTTGIYLALMTRADGYQNYLIFVLRDDSSTGLTPPGLTILAQAPLRDQFGNVDLSNTTVYTAPSGALVFSAGSIQWADALDNFDLVGLNWGTVQGQDSRVQGISANVLAALAQPPGVVPPQVTAPSAGPSLLANGGFEAGIAPWTLVQPPGTDITTGGASWTAQMSGVVTSLYGSVCASSTLCLIVGSDDVLLSSATAFSQTVMPHTVVSRTTSRRPAASWESTALFLPSLVGPASSGPPGLP